MSEWKVLFEESFWESAREEDPAFEVGMEIERPIPTVEHPEQMNRIRGDDEPEMLYPSHFVTVFYAVEPEPAEDQFCLKACAKGDSPIAKGCGAAVASSIAVIGGADGPTSVFVAGKVRSELHMKSICSPLFFEPTPVREWYVMYYVKRREDLSVDLIC